jgi:tetratricopeptide (TPR) repeat protein
MYESLAGEPPLVGNNPISTMYKQINELPSPLTMKSAYGVNNIILKALQKDPAKRYQSALELSEELERVNVNSSSLSMFLSKFQLQIQQIKSIVINKLGSSKRPLVLVFVLTAMLISIGSTSILPLVFCKYPSGTELILKWRPLPSLLHFNQQMMLRNEDRRRELTRILETLSKSENIKPNPESIQLHRELGDIYFLNTNWVPAGHEYRAALSEGLTLFNKTYTNYGALPAFIHDICLSYLRYSQCQLVQRDYKEALTLATAGLRMSFSDADRDASYKAYFGQVMAVSSINLLSLVDSRSADYISKFSDYIESKRPTGIEAGRAALALSEVADCYIKLGAWERAIPILKKAKECWNRYESSEPSLQRNKNFVKFLPGAAEHFDIFALDYARKGKCGPYNSAVASELVAIAYEKIGNWQYADKYLLESSSEFESLLGLNDKSRCLVLFERANELWKRGSYFSSLAQKIEAQKIWVYRKNGTTEDKIPFNDKRFQWPPE